ncbi:MAG: glucose-6-phosphate isomerase [Corticimicrobacter sp.]|uniref:glucose-6-phosphate isomerase n=1 Tax=Corticimicrobacter sp. TaxID=2678536 RepID=UPI0032DA408F
MTPPSLLPGLPELTTLPEWQAFVRATGHTHRHAQILRILPAAGLHVDVSAQPLSPALDQAASDLLAVRGFERAREALFAGQAVNVTEQRAAWHTMLRAPAPIAEVVQARQHLLDFVHRADTERRWRNIVHIGIGGSDWGVRLAVAAFGNTGVWRQIRFVSNIDGHAIAGGLAGLDPHQTLIVVASKSFATAETLENARRALEWMRAADVPHPEQQLVAITAQPQRAQDFGVPSAHIFPFWEWVGGRFSLWSSVSLSAALTVGTDVISGMQAGAAAMDQHFLQAPPVSNAPVQMALAGIANRSVLGYGSLNLAVYDSRLFYLVPYLQQLEMESLGKSVDIAGQTVQVATGPAVWGMPGTDAQHTFFQWLHQGSDGAPTDFIVCQQADHRWPGHHRQLLAHCLAQREALLRGKSYEDALAEAHALAPDDPQRQAWLARHKTHTGGRPSSLIVLPRLSPYTLGALLALYEHKIFVQALIWGINPFDQWGVEFGKNLASRILQEWAGSAPPSEHDASTRHWIDSLS